VGDTVVSWDYGSYDKVLPAKDGSNYTWTWSGLEVLSAGSFKIRQGDDWSKMNLGYNDVTMAGSGADNFGATDDGNFKPVADGTFELVLTVDAAVGDFTLTAEPSTK